MNFSSKFERDWEFYYNNRKTFYLDPAKAAEKKMVKFSYAEDGKSAKECFYIFDSTGKCSQCKEMDLLREIFNCKASVNFNIKMWAEHRAEMLSWVDNVDGIVSVNDRVAWAFTCYQELEEIKSEYNTPDWVIDAIKEQAKKLKGTMGEKESIN
jgi:hypothetical protein